MAMTRTLAFLMVSAASPPACQTCGCVETSCATCHAPADCSNCVSCCCDSAHLSWRRMRIRSGIMVEYFSSAWMVVEASGSIVFGFLAGSLALLAFGGDSLIELISCLAVLVYLRKDERGSEMHDSKRTGQLTSALLFSLIPIIALGAVCSYVAGLRPEGSPVGIAVAGGAAMTMPYLWSQKRRIGRETRSLPLSIDAIESVTCFFMSVALLGGLVVEYFTGLWWVDYLAAAAILAFVAKEALGSYHELQGNPAVLEAKLPV